MYKFEKSNMLVMDVNEYLKIEFNPFFNSFFFCGYLFELLSADSNMIFKRISSYKRTRSMASGHLTSAHFSFYSNYFFNFLICIYFLLFTVINY